MNSVHRDSVSFLVDASSGPGGSTEVVRAALHSIGITIREWMRKGDNRFDTSVVIYNAKALTKSNADAAQPLSKPYTNVHTIMSFEDPNPDDLLRLIWLGTELEDCDEDSRALLDGQLRSERTPSGLEDGLKVAATQFCQLLEKTYKRLILVTSQTEADANLDHVMAAFRNLTSLNVSVVPIFLSVTRGEVRDLNKNNKYVKFWKKLYNSKSYNLNTNEEAWRNDLSNLVRSKAERKTANFRGKLIIDNLEIGIAGYNILTDPTEIEPHYFLPTKAEGEYKRVHSVSTVHLAPTVGKKKETQNDGRMTLNTTQSNILKDIATVSHNEMVIVKFHEVWALPELLSVRTPLFIIPSDFHMENSSKAFSSLHRIMRKRRRVAEVVFYRTSSPESFRRLPVRGYLFAFDYSGAGREQPPTNMSGRLSSDFGMHFVPVATASETRLKPLRKTHRDITPMLPDMHHLLHRFWSPEGFQPDMFYNPATYQFARVSEQIAFDLAPPDPSSDPPETLDSTLPNYDFITSHLPPKSVLYSSFLGDDSAAGITNRMTYIPETWRSNLDEKDFNVPFTTLRLLFILIVGDQKFLDRLCSRVTKPSVKATNEISVSTWLSNYVWPGASVILHTCGVPMLIHSIVQGAYERDLLRSVPMVLKQLVCEMYRVPPPRNWRAIDSTLITIFEKNTLNTKTRRVVYKSRGISVYNSPDEAPQSLPTQTAFSTPIPSRDESQSVDDIQMLSQIDIATQNGTPSSNPSQSQFETSIPSQLDFLPETSSESLARSVPSTTSETGKSEQQRNTHSSLNSASSMMSRTQSSDDFTSESSTVPHVTGHHNATNGSTKTSSTSIGSKRRVESPILLQQFEKNDNIAEDSDNERIKRYSASSAEHTDSNGTGITPSVKRATTRASKMTQKSSSPTQKASRKNARSKNILKPEFIPADWKGSLVNGTWMTDLDPFELVMIGELLGVYNRDPATVQAEITSYLRTAINKQRRAILRANHGVAKPVAQKLLIEKSSKQAENPRKLHDHVRDAFTTQDPSVSITGIMLRTVSRMYGLPSAAPMDQIVSGSKAIFSKKELSPVHTAPLSANSTRTSKDEHEAVNISNRRSTAIASKRGSKRTFEMLQEGDDDDEIERLSLVKKKRNIEPEHVDQENSEFEDSELSDADEAYNREVNLSGAAYSDLSGIEKLRLAFTPEERKSINKETLRELDRGNLDLLNARQLQSLCKRLKVRNQGKCSASVSRIREELEL